MTEVSQLALDVETLSQRLEFCSGGELLSTLEELEAIAAAQPDAAMASAPALFALLSDPATAGAEATQQAVEVVSRLSKAQAAAALVAEPSHIQVLLDLLESEAAETYTIVVALELLAALSEREPVGLGSAVLAAPAGAARLLDTLSDARDEVRNASVQLWERLTRPEDAGEETADELRTCCAFNDGFAKIFAAMDKDASVARDAARLAANVLAGPAVAADMLAQSEPALVPLGKLLALPAPPDDDEEDEATEKVENEDDEAPRRRVRLRQQRAALLAEALDKAAASLLALWRLLARTRGDARAKKGRQSTVWSSDAVLPGLLSLALDSLTEDEDAPAQIHLQSDKWWTRDLAGHSTRGAVRCAALEVLRLCVVDNQAHAIAMCEAAFGDYAVKRRALRVALELAARGSASVGLAARGLVEATWAPEGAAIVVVMHAVAPPPSDDDVEAAAALDAVSSAVIDDDEAVSRRGLSLLRSLLARSPSVRELALKVPSFKDRDDDLFGDVVRRLFGDTTAAATTTQALAVLCAWLEDNGAAAHAILRDPDNADGLAMIARASGDKRIKGLASLALGLCLENFGDEERAGWTRPAVQSLVDRRVGLGTFTQVAQRLFRVVGL